MRARRRIASRRPPFRATRTLADALAGLHECAAPPPPRPWMCCSSPSAPSRLPSPPSLLPNNPPTRSHSSRTGKTRPIRRRRRPAARRQADARPLHGPGDGALRQRRPLPAGRRVSAGIPLCRRRPRPAGPDGPARPHLQAGTPFTPTLTDVTDRSTGRQTGRPPIPLTLQARTPDPHSEGESET